MRFDLSQLLRRDKDAPRRAPSHLFGGRVRTSTLVLIVAFFALWWTYGTYRPHPEAPHSNTPAPSQVVPPGYVPDPDYTWVPRTRVQQPPRTPMPTTTTPMTPPTTTTTTPPPFPTLPCLLPPPFCPATTSPSAPPNVPPSTPQPGPGPSPNAGPGEAPAS